MIALVCLLVMGLIVAALGTYAMATSRSSVAYARVREERYAADGAVKAAINWAAENHLVGRDPTIDLSDPACRYAYEDPNVGSVTVSCDAEAGGGSGRPAELGLQPPEALLLLGNRDGETGPYNDIPCSGWWDTFSGFFELDYTSRVNYPRGQRPEPSGLFRTRTGLGTLSTTCNSARSRSRSAFSVDGDLVAAGQVAVEDGGQVAVAGTARVRDGCAANVSNCTTTIGTRSGFSGSEAYLNGTPRDTDPARTDPSSPAATVVGSGGDLATPWQPVGFDTQGNPLPLGYAATTAMPSAMPERTTAYLWNSTTGALTPTNSCVGSSATVVFLPGWYKQSEVLNRYTTSGNCADTTMWFAPDPGPDGLLLTEDDRTGAFYLDFRSGSAAGCNGMPANRSRWCVGGDASHSPRIVVGTPIDWTPQGVYDPGSPSAPATSRVSIDQAGTVDLDLSQSWHDNPAANASTIDGSIARYEADVCLIWCFSSDRAIRLRDFTTTATAPPVDGKVFLTVSYGVENPAAVNGAQAVIEAVSPESGRKSCGTYSLFPKGQADVGNPASPTVHEYTFTDAQAAQLGAACGKIDLINGLEIKVQVTGNNFNSPRSNWYLDGVRVEYDALPGASFPNPVGTGPVPSGAQSDCDPEAAGGQLIFGGESHVYVADGSLEICAGVYPTDPNNHQSIGIWAVPSVSELKPTGTMTPGGGTSLSSTANGVEIDGATMKINYGADCGWDITCTADGPATVAMPGYTPPAGYRITKITGRFGYHPRNESCTGLFGCPGEAPQLETSGCGRQSFPKMSQSEPVLQIANYPAAVLYDSSAGVNCIGVASGGTSLGGHSFTWHARGGCFVTCSYSDDFDGAAYQITIAPVSASSAKLIPQTGCIVAHPNYNGGTGAPHCAGVRADTSSF
ncbi:MAG: hypothetical protein KDB31_02115, partial [Microthrixaceae bacterium]|nr:hypothetical protein [Microthrixaceae bacterium]